MDGGGPMQKAIFTGANSVVVTVVREARLAAGLTQAELGRRLSRDQSHISLIEGSQRRLDVVEFIELAHALGADPQDLLREILRRLG